MRGIGLIELLPLQRLQKVEMFLREEFGHRAFHSLTMRADSFCLGVIAAPNARRQQRGEL